MILIQLHFDTTFLCPTIVSSQVALHYSPLMQNCLCPPSSAFQCCTWQSLLQYHAARHLEHRRSVLFGAASLLHLKHLLLVFSTTMFNCFTRCSSPIAAARLSQCIPFVKLGLSRGKGGGRIESGWTRRSPKRLIDSACPLSAAGVTTWIASSGDLLAPCMP